MNNQEIPPQIKEYVLNALNETYEKASQHIDSGLDAIEIQGNNAKVTPINTGIQNFLVDFIVQLLVEIGVVSIDEQEKIRSGVEDLISKYKNKRGEA
jgi:hypothetical protein